ncbi:M56 family metallopeptidase [Dyadobacter sp. CY326]|uniref:M56 family metallopeptidase n=1 Tax=Dyadobacter sp. CY326 TaxID=2907300 RepID=UPI001F356A26|nr:M56 family metallopeptidase [Dyadobacter sp. CY326]MCE7067527.1 M48 family metalloprotease [Dyadobacter sp. CY326]
MKLLPNLLTEAAVASFGWTLIHSLWQATLIAIIAVASFYLLRRKSANLKYIAGVGFLFAQVFASAVTFLYYYFRATSAAMASKPAANVLHFASSTVSRVTDYKLPLSFKVQMWISAHLYELVVCWLIGAAFLLLRFAGGWIFTERLRFKANIVMDKEWRARFGVMTAKMNITQSVEFRETAKIVTPMVIGALSPVVLIPIGLLSGFSTAQVEAILAHELAHIRRNDYLINMLQSFVEVVFFFHPAIWWLSDRIRAEREHCCDDIALSVCGDKMSLAHALVKVAEWQHTPGFAMAFASKKPLLLQRVQRVLGLTPKPARTIGNLPIMLFALSLVIGISVYAVAQKVDKQKESKKVIKHASKKHVARVRPLIDIEEIPSVDFDENFEIDEVAEMEPFHIDPVIEGDIVQAFEFSMAKDTVLQKRLDEYQKQMEVFENEMRPLRQRMEELNLEMEKHRFEVERFEREQEKIEWKKDHAAELRSELMEKRSALFDRGEDKANQSAKPSETDLEKQLADFEQKIKVQEQAISELNAQISANRKEEIKVEEPMRKLEQEIEEIDNRIQEISRKMERESESIGRLEDDSAPRLARMPRPARAVKGTGRVAPPPPPPAAVAPAKPAKPAKVPSAPAAPQAPVPPAKR